ncbi:MAG TPA: FG-GAP-like repeat-containing protein [Bryobacteraceae bacterium]|nr:FG-GAP-like repeat-containing protein [Bryobacteraceae bacterium]
MGYGSEGLAVASLASGSQVVAQTTDTTVQTGILSPGATIPQPAGEYTVGPNPQHLITADFNGDGIADLAVSNFGNLDTDAGGNITILLGKGDGTFTVGPPINAGATPVAMYSADFNGDGKPDIAVGNLTNRTISVLLGNGNGTFGSPTSYSVAADPESIVAGDWSGDGKIDLAVASQGGTIDVLLGNGDGTFRAAVPYAGGARSATYLTFMDLNGDGKLDLMVANEGYNSISFLFGNGDGTFQAPVQNVTGAEPLNFAPVADGSGGFVLTSIDGVAGELTIIPLNTGGIAASPQLHAMPGIADGIAAADLNGDGYPDMIVAAGSISVLLRNPQGEFNTPVNYPLQSGSQAVTLATADLNGDGKPDVVASSMFTANNGSFGGTLDVALGNGGGTLGTQTSYAIGGYPGGFTNTPPSGVVVADFNGDGKPDVAAGYQADPTGSGSGGVSVLINRGGGVLGAAVNYAVGNFSVYCTGTGDFNGDGKMDLAVCAGGANFNFSSAGAIGILTGVGDGTFRPASLLQVGSPAGFPQAMAVGDVNGDGKPDLVVSLLSSQGNTSIVVLLGNGNGTFRQLTPFSTPASGGAVALVDLNGDGVPDLVVGDSIESVYQLGNGDGTFQAPSYFRSGANVTGFAVADWNHNGVSGLAVAQKFTVMAMVSSINPRLYSNPPTLGIALTHTGNFNQGQQGATYTITVSNASNAAPVAGIVTVTDTLPPGLTLVSMTGNGWTCSGITCTRNDALAGGSVYDPITLNVNVSGNAASPQVNVASVSGGGSATSSTTDSTIIAGSGPPPAVLSITKAHAGNFMQGQQGGTYTVTVANTAGAGTTSGTVTVTETVPSGLTLASMSGSGWTCTAGANTCSRSDSLAGGSSYAPITVVVNVAANAGSPLVNSVSVSGGGSAAASATDSTTITGGAPTGLAFFPVTPCRVADTRPGQGFSGQFGPPTMNALQTRSFPIPSSGCHIPSNAQAYSLNITAVPAATLGYLTIWPAGQTQPVVSTLNSSNGAILANAAIVPAGTGGAVNVFVTDVTDVIIDINGYFAPPAASGLAFYPVTPCRIADTRGGPGFSGQFGPPSMSAGQTRSFTVPQSSCAIPAAAQAYSLNMTVVPPGPLTFLTTWPAGQTQPTVSTLNALQGQIAANAAVVPAGSGGAISVFVSNPSNVIIDINGYFAPPGGPGALYFHPFTPCRVADTRGAAGPLGGPQLAAGTTRMFPVQSSSCNIPATAQAYSFNMTAVPPGSLLYLSTWPAGQTQPVVSTLNDLQGQIIANAAIVPAGSAGGIDVFVPSATNVILDINGYFGQP